jgi:hypothetical protein
MICSSSNTGPNRGSLVRPTKLLRRVMMPQKVLLSMCAWAVLFGTLAVYGGQAPDGMLKITRRSVAGGIGLTWGEGVLMYQGKEYPFTFHASGRLRDVDVKTTAAELSGEVFNLKNLEDFNGNYQSVEGEKSTGGGTRATIKNRKGVVLNIVSTVEGRKFSIAREGMDIEIKKAKF